ncbi:MAG TPA: hypothetical protein VGI96_09095 [Streptosporangiaceae bacterium]|jgi:hypothetical protein
MRGERHALRAGKFLVSLACRRLPARLREERYQEWLAELPVILHDRDAGPAPLRMVRMLVFAAGTLRGTTLARGAYREPYLGVHRPYQGVHRGARRDGVAKTIRLLAVGLLVLGVLLGGVLALLAYEGYLIDQLITGASVAFSASLALGHLAGFAASRIPRWRTAAVSWYSMGKVAAAGGLLVRAIASQSGWGHPLLFAIISYCGYAISVACLGRIMVLIVRSVQHELARNDQKTRQ